MSNSSPTVLNTILWGNSPRQLYGSGTIPVTYSDIQGGWTGEGNIDADPLFVDANNSIYYLKSGSPCLSKAKCDGAPATDKDGRPRPLGSGCDIGCYEQLDCGFIYGDTSWDCNVTAYDAALVLQYVVGSKNLSEGQLKAADVTGNGSITALDAALILQYTVGLITQFPVQTQNAAPVLAAKSEADALMKVITQLDAVVLNREQKQVLEQLKSLVFKKSLPKHTVLFQNFPNPFNPDTWLPYQLAQDAYVTINIYNVRGQLVRTLNLGNQNAGVYMTKDKAAYWNGKDGFGEKMASGVYFYTLQAGDFRAIRKMVIVK